MRQSLQFTVELNCEKHHKPLNVICTAPECFHYRQLCASCIKQDSHHNKMHLQRQQAYFKVDDTINNIVKGLKALRTKIIQKMDASINSHDGLKEVSSKLERIKAILNDKIDQFKGELSKLYEMNIKKKLNDLFLIVEKSYQFLQQQRLKLLKTEKLKPFLTSDLSHQLRYYQSYYEEILQKNVRKFKTGFEHDRVMKLVISFQQNLSKIFNFQQQFQTTTEKPHLLHSNYTSHYLIELRQHKYPSKRQLTFIPETYNWIGIIPSVYYPFNRNYYLFGEGKRQSNKISRINMSNQEFRQLDIKMETKRSNFSVIVLKDEIYIVGGQNSKEGCLIKCEKFIPNQGKTYIVNSLHQRSSQHTLCTYKNKFILKFGGTDIMQTILEHHEERFKALHPQIYSIQNEEWRVISFSHTQYDLQLSPINFGLWPAVFSCNEQNKIIVLEGDRMKSRNIRTRYNIFLGEQNKDDSGNKSKDTTYEDYFPELNVQISNIQLPFTSEITFFSNTYIKNEGNIRFLVQDARHRFSTASIII